MATTSSVFKLLFRNTVRKPPSSHFFQCPCFCSLSTNSNISSTNRAAINCSRAASSISVQKTNLDVQLENYYEESVKHEDYFDVLKLVSLEECFKARMHLGHKRDLWNDAFREYLYGTRIDVDIIDLEKTVPRLRRALNVIAHVAFRNGIILFVAKPGFREAHYLDDLAIQVGEYSHTRKWQKGQMASKATAWSSSVKMPDLIVMFCCHDSIFQQHEAINEAASLGIATVGLVDSNCDPRLLTYPVPGNDDSPSSVRLFGTLVSHAIIAGKQKRVSVLNSLGIPTTLDDLCSYNKDSLYSGTDNSRIKNKSESLHTRNASGSTILSSDLSDPADGMRSKVSDALEDIGDFSLGADFSD